MIFHPVAPRSEEWQRLRLGIPTSSNFHRIITAGGKPSDQAPVFMNQLLAEYILQQQLDEVQTKWMIRGIEEEDAAYRAFEFLTDTETNLGGFFTDDRGLIGCSPDRLIDPEGILELKSPSPQVMISYLLDGSSLVDKYKPQLQGMLWLTEREYVKIIAHNSEFPIRLVSVPRDEQYIVKLSAAVQTFVDCMIQRREVLKSEHGIEPKIVEPPRELDLSRYELTKDDEDMIVADRFPK